MAYAITLGLDPESAAPVIAMWETLASRGLSEAALRPGYPPHLTLAVFADSADPPRLIAAARELAGKWRRCKVSFVSLGLFPGTPTTLFLAPVVTTTLIGQHRDLLSCLADQPVTPHYQVGRWVPHATLASDLTDPTAAVASLDPPKLPIAAVLDRIEVVRFRPIEILESHRLIAS